MNDRYNLNTEIVNFDEVELPNTLYKYRNWSKENNREIISKREVFFAPPASFPDPFDCKIPKRWDLLSYNDIVNKYYNLSLQRNIRFSKYEHIEYAVDWANNTAINHPEFVQKHQQQEFNEYSEHTGVLSLTEFADSLPMWEMYAKDHTGFCVGFNPSIMLKDLGGGGGKVRYLKDLPIIYPEPKHSFSVQAFLQVFSKLEKWVFEQEYRVYKFKPYTLKAHDRIVSIPAEAYKEVIIGALMSTESVDCLINSFPAELEHVIVKRAYIENGKIVIKPFIKD
jgi:hypothetical protein